LQNSILDTQTRKKNPSGELPPKKYFYRSGISSMGVLGIVYFGDYMTTTEINNEPEICFWKKENLSNISVISGSFCKNLG